MAAILPITRRLIIAGGFAVAAMAPTAVTIASAPSGPPAHLADCPRGEDADIYNGTCTPYLVPNSPVTRPAGAHAGTPNASLCPPGVSGTECGSPATGRSEPVGPPGPGLVVPQQPAQELQDVSTPGY